MANHRDFYAGKRVFVTGGSSGIGRAVALELARAGASVWISARGEKRLQETVAELEKVGSGTFGYTALDIADRFKSLGKTVVFGGPHVSLAPDVFAGHCDSMVVGELESVSEAFFADMAAGALRPRYDAPAADMRASVGQVAGSVTWRQYLRAGLRVLEGAQAVLPLDVRCKWRQGQIKVCTDRIKALLRTDTINKLEG